MPFLITERRVSQSTITVYGQKHHKLHYTEMDQLIEVGKRKRVSIIIVKICLNLNFLQSGEVVANDTNALNR